MMTLNIKERRSLIQKTVEALSRIPYIKEVYLFGSMVEGKITGSSDIDLLIVVGKKNIKESYIEIALFLEKEINDKSYLIDIHVISEEMLREPPFIWILHKAEKII